MPTQTFRLRAIEHGVSADELDVIAKGKLEATGTTEAERSRDRRVDVIPK